MQNNVKECWFYQLCKKECAKDVGLIFVGIALIIVCLLLFTVVISTYQILGIIFGIALIIGGFAAFFGKLPKVRTFLESMPSEWYKTLGNVPPKDMYKTFYFTDYYLCIPGEYVMVRYTDILDIKITENRTNGVTNGYTVGLVLAGAKNGVDASVKEWKSFGTTYQQLVDEINARKLAMAQAVQG